MSIKRLTRAAEAAGYAMVHADDSPPENDLLETAPQVQRADQGVVRSEIPASAPTSYAAVAQQWLGAVVGGSAT